MSIELSTNNLNRLIRSLIPPSPAQLAEMCQQGYNDAIDYLQRNNLISCEECSKMQISFLVENKSLNLNENCQDCVDHHLKSNESSVPDKLMNVLMQQIEEKNCKLSKIVRIVSLPVVAPCSVAIK
jgi:hypothetical protein